MNTQSREASQAAIFFDRLTSDFPTPRFPVQRYGTISDVVRINLEALLPNMERVDNLTGNQIESWLTHYEHYLSAVTDDLLQLVDQKREQLKVKNKWLLRAKEIGCDFVSKLPSDVQSNIWEFLPYSARSRAYRPFREEQMKVFMKMKGKDLREFARKFVTQVINRPVSQVASDTRAYTAGSAGEFFCAVDHIRPRIPAKKQDIVICLFTTIDQLIAVNGTTDCRGLCAKMSWNATQTLRYKVLCIEREITRKQEHRDIKNELFYLDAILKRALESSTRRIHL